MKKPLTFVVIIFLFISVNGFLVQNRLVSELNRIEEPYVGVAFCGNTTAEAKLLIDRVKTFTNLFVLQSGPISKNETAVNTICDYAASQDLDFIVFFGWFDFHQPWQIPWLDYAKSRWSDKFLGVYLYDEPGGIQIDYNWNNVFHLIKEHTPDFYESMSPYVEGDLNQTTLRDYDEAWRHFKNYIKEEIQIDQLLNRSIPPFTADYAAYWFDYLAGYDTVLVELGWGHDTSQHIGLGRGAADAQQKDWGTIIVWDSCDPNDSCRGTYKTGPQMLQDMQVSYETGAKYIIIFNYPTNPPGNPYGILTEEHFQALQQFWNYMQEKPSDFGKIKAQAALVLPRNYAWGMRHPDDRIWGPWGPDENSPQIWNATQILLDQYGLSLDIVYDDPLFQIGDKYEHIYYWNSSISQK